MVIKDHVELKAAPFEREAALSFLYENDVFRIDDARHIHYLEVTVINSQDAQCPGSVAGLQGNLFLGNKCKTGSGAGRKTYIEGICRLNSKITYNTYRSAVFCWTLN